MTAPGIAECGREPHRESVLQALADQRVVPVIRSPTPRQACAVARACARAGMRVVELTRSTPDVESALRELTEEGLLVGVGTIADARYIESAVAAGARFVVSFANPRGFVAAARAAGVPAIPGALTPSEIAAAAASGADAVKIFPASTVSPSYLVSLRPVLPDVKLVVTGGIRATAEDIHPWLSAGALAVGVGGLAEAETEDDITSRAASLLTQLDA